VFAGVVARIECGVPLLAACLTDVSSSDCQGGPPSRTFENAGNSECRNLIVERE